MKVSRIKIEKFRSIENGEFNIDDIICIVGQNNSGKTAILKALNCFFNIQDELQNLIEGEHFYSTSNAVPKITITFNEVPINGVYDGFINNEELVVKFEFRRPNRYSYKVKNGNAFENCSEILLTQLLSEVKFVLIPSERSSTFIENIENSLLSKLVNTYFENHTRHRDRLTPEVIRTFTYLKTNALDRLARQIDGNYLTNKGFSLNINSNRTINYQIFTDFLNIKIVENNNEFKLSECGSGVQSLVAIAIYRYLANADNTNYIIAIEEPETNIHPQGQKEMILSLFEELEDNDIQIIFTTHSPTLIDQLPHNKVVLVRKVTDARRGFKSKITQINSDFWIRNSIPYDNYQSFHKFKNSEIFYANHIIVTEGKTDCQIFSILLERNNISLIKKGISIIELDSINSLKHIYYLLKELEIPKTIIVDKDFFFEYLNNNEKSLSRNPSGYFLYQPTYRTDQPLINHIFSNVADRVNLETNLRTNHTNALSITETYDCIVMNYNLEMDILSSAAAITHMYNKLTVMPANRNTNFLFINNRKAIKEFENLKYVVENISPVNYPRSISRLINRIRNI